MYGEWVPGCFIIALSAGIMCPCFFVNDVDLAITLIYIGLGFDMLMLGIIYGNR